MRKMPGHTMSYELQALRREVDALRRNSVSGTAISFSPTLTATSVNPGLGSAPGTPRALGRYVRLGDLVYYSGLIQFGGTGASAGTGSYQISLPFTSSVALSNSPIWPVAAPHSVPGHWWMHGAATDAVAFPWVSSDSDVMLATYPVTYPTGAETFVGAAAPWAWGNNHSIEFSVIYMAQPY